MFVRWFCFSWVAASLLMGIVAHGAEAGSDLVGRISRIKSLPETDRAALLDALQDKTLKKLPVAEFESVRKEALRFSEGAIGRRSNGKLIDVVEPADKRLLQIAGEYLNSLPPENTPAHAKAGELYGRISPGAPRISRQVLIDPKSERWHTTGMYAAPGEVVSVRIPEPWAKRGLKVRISGHTDRISLEKKLQRLPTAPSRSFDMTSVETRAASAFGGAVYIDTGDKPLNEAAIPVMISNAIAAPDFKLGSTRPDQWRDSLRSAPAPYAELASDRVILSIPSEWVREIDDPTELMRFWDHVVALHDELGGFARLRTCPERVNVDVQISAGLFHAGYPMQGPQSACQGLADLAKLKTEGNWGWFHELGHEAQRRPDKAWSWDNPYTFDGAVEATVNLFSTHAYNELGISPKGGWAWTVDPKQVAEKARKAIDSKLSYARAEVGTKLAMWLQIRDGFGWAPISAVLKSYSDDQDEHPEMLPKNPQEERDQLCIRLSRQVKRNLYPFLHDVWGMEVSDTARDHVSDLPAWMPDGFTTP